MLGEPADEAKPAEGAHRAFKIVDPATGVENRARLDRSRFCELPD